jgi:hypothetical protein
VSDRRIPVAVHGTARADPQATFDAIVPIELPRIFRGFGPLPAVRSTRDQSGDWDHAGASRVVELSDATEVGEQITAYERPRYFAYRVGPFEAGPLRRLVVDATGEWRFSACGGGSATAIEWTYTFRPRPFARPVVALIARLWHAYAERALALAIYDVERCGR